MDNLSFFFFEKKIMDNLSYFILRKGRRHHNICTIVYKGQKIEIIKYSQARLSRQVNLQPKVYFTICGLLRQLMTETFSIGENYILQFKIQILRNH